MMPGAPFDIRDLDPLQIAQPPDRKRGGSRTRAAVTCAGCMGCLGLSIVLWIVSVAIAVAAVRIVWP